MSDDQAPIKRKLIEVALPLEAINKSAKAEKDRKVGKPQQIHHWWARRPIVAARAVLFAQLVDDPSSNIDAFPTPEAQAIERRRLFDIIERLVEWDSLQNTQLLREASDEIAKSVGSPLPSILDPFAGGGSIPLEAQRLGLPALATDLNPVAVLINKALIEVPQRWSGQRPIFPSATDSRLGEWVGSSGLAEDVKKYGELLRAEAEAHLSDLYPTVTVNRSEERPLAWIWARTVPCPNPACGIRMPLARSWWLSKKKGKEALIEPRINGERVEFSIRTNLVSGASEVMDGTVSRIGATCLACKTAVPLEYIRSEGTAGRLGATLIAMVVGKDRRRIYVAPTDDHEKMANIPIPEDALDTELPPQALGFRVQRYGMTKHADLFSPRQLTSLIQISALVEWTKKRVIQDAQEAGLPLGDSLDDGGRGALAYGESVALYLALAVSRLADWSNSLCRWESTGQVSQQLFGKQTISMVWDYSEAAVLGTSSGSLHACLAAVERALRQLSGTTPGKVKQADARDSVTQYTNFAISTDPPYYDNVPYADLSDVFYIWLRRMLSGQFPGLLSTLVTPKATELVADPFRRGGPQAAARYFEQGFKDTFENALSATRSDIPMTLYYAFKQTESDVEGTTSTGWQTLLEAIISAGWSITGTWPLRTEMNSRMRGQAANALASSVVLACRPRPEGAPSTTRRAFLSLLKRELPNALKELQQGSIAPVDLAQAAIGPGMAVFSRYSMVIEPDGSAMKVKNALAEINRALDEVLAEQEGDFDTDTRFCVKWFSQFGWDEAASGSADDLSRAVNTSVDGLVRGGIFWQRAGKARLIEPDELSEDWDPKTDGRISVWEVVLRLSKALDKRGVAETARLMAAAGERVDLDSSKELAYLLFSICERRKWTQTARLFNGLGTSWSDLSAAARTGGVLTPPSSQGELDFASIEE